MLSSFTREITVLHRQTERWSSYGHSLRIRNAKMLTEGQNTTSGALNDIRSGMSGIATGGESDDSPVCRPARQLASIGKLQFAQHGGHMRFNGFDGDEQLCGHLLVGVAAGDEAHHLLFARRE